MAAQDMLPDQVLVSSAVRTQQTFERWRVGAQWSGSAQTESGLYLASGEEICTRVAELDDRDERVLVPPGDALVGAPSDGILDAALGHAEPELRAVVEQLRGLLEAGQRLFGENRVQEAGETIVVPDGWYHGTCNTARWTVGWGGQGWRAEAEPPRCFHCRARGQLQYATTTSAVLTASDALAMSARFDSIGSLDALDMRRLLRIGQAAYMGVRSVFGQFVAQSAMAAETTASSSFCPR